MKTTDQGTSFSEKINGYEKCHSPKGKAAVTYSNKSIDVFFSIPVNGQGLRIEVFRNTLDDALYTGWSNGGVVLWNPRLGFDEESIAKVLKEIDSSSEKFVSNCDAMLEHLRERESGITVYRELVHWISDSDGLFHDFLVDLTNRVSDLGGA